MDELIEELIEDYKARLIVAGVAFRMLFGAWTNARYTTDQRAVITCNAMLLMSRASIT